MSTVRLNGGGVLSPCIVRVNEPDAWPGVIVNVQELFMGILLQDAGVIVAPTGSPDVV